VTIVSPKKDKIKAWAHTHWSRDYAVDQQLEAADPKTYDALLLPGGVMNPDKLRANEKAVAFVKHFMDNKKPIAAICHGPWTLIETKQLANRKLTSYHSIKSDLINAGADWVDQEVVIDGNLVTSRHPGDLPVFIEKMIEVLQSKIE
jgi:protease I